MKLTMKHLLLGLGTIGAVAAPVAAVVACGNNDDNKVSISGVDSEINLLHPLTLIIKIDNNVKTTSDKLAEFIKQEASKTTDKVEFKVNGVDAGSFDYKHGTVAEIKSQLETLATNQPALKDVFSTTPVVTGATAAQISAVKTAITAAQTAGITVINAATDAAGVDSALATAKEAVTKAIASPVVASDVTAEVSAANSALNSAATAKKATFAPVVTGATQAQIDAVKTAITAAQTAGVTAINGATDAAGVDSALATAKAAVTAAIASPVVASDVTTETTAANAALDKAATDKKAALATPAAGKTFVLNKAALSASFHAMFQNSLKIKDGDIIELTIGADKLSYTWTAADTTQAASWTFTSSGSQQAIVDYVASKLANANHDAAAIKAELGFTSTPSMMHQVTA